jgi:hypothetical protein
MAKKTITITIDDGEPTNEDNAFRPPRSSFIREYPTNDLVNHKTRNNGWVDGIDRCASCPNDPRNGGSGVCFCTIPHMYGPNRITCVYA